MSSDRDQIIERLADIATALDTRDWDGLGELFTESATGYGAAGREQIVRTVRDHLGGCGPSQHLLGKPQGAPRARRRRGPGEESDVRAGASPRDGRPGRTELRVLRRVLRPVDQDPRGLADRLQAVPRRLRPRRLPDTPARLTPKCGSGRRSVSSGLIYCSPIWTRTRNPSINSRMLCQLSYGGLLPVTDEHVGHRELTLVRGRPSDQIASSGDVGRGAHGLLEQSAPVFLQRHEVAEQRRVPLRVGGRTHPLDLGLEVRDLAGHPHLL